MSREPAGLSLHVECYSGSRAEETPRRLRWAGRAEEIVAVLDRWLAPDHRYFKVRVESGATYILRHDVASGTWDWTMYRRPGGEA